MWLARTPSALVRAYADMLPRLRAEDQLAAINAYILGRPSSVDDPNRWRRAQALQQLEALALGATGSQISIFDSAALQRGGFGVRRFYRPKVTDG